MWPLLADEALLITEQNRHNYNNSGGAREAAVGPINIA